MQISKPDKRPEDMTVEELEAYLKALLLIGRQALDEAERVRAILEERKRAR